MKTIGIAITFFLSFSCAYAQDTANAIKLPEGPPIVEVLYIIDGVPSDNKAFKRLDPEDIISTRILKNHQLEFSCIPPRDFIIIKTKNGLTKREARKLKRSQKRRIRHLF